jgi:hypothetical protein
MGAKLQRIRYIYKTNCTRLRGSRLRGGKTTTSIFEAALPALTKDPHEPIKKNALIGGVFLYLIAGLTIPKGLRPKFLAGGGYFAFPNGSIPMETTHQAMVILHSQRVYPEGDNSSRRGLFEVELPEDGGLAIGGDGGG